MRWTLALAAMLAALPVKAQQVGVSAAVYRERADERGSQVEPAILLARGDRVVTIVTWDAPRGGTYTIVTPVPAGLALQSASHRDLHVSSDGGRTWRRLVDPDNAPRDATHLRWQVVGDGRLSYRALVR